MDVYRYVKLAVSGRMPDRVKLLGLLAFLVTGRRMAGVFLDPVLGCNLRCRMCHMSVPESSRVFRGQRMETAALQRVAAAFFPRALKLQIGCATEPTLYPHLGAIIASAKGYGVPYVSLTTNGKLIAQGRVSLLDLAEAGLDELTLSLHGTTRAIYEELMPGAKFDELLALSPIIAQAKERYPGLKLRVNYTINSLNILDLTPDRFWAIWPEGARPDIVQLRPVQNLGDTAWNDFDLTPLKTHYSATIGALRRDCQAAGIVCIAPDLGQIDEVATGQSQHSALIKEVTYCYVSPDSTYAEDFAPTDTYGAYHRRKKTAWRLFRSIFQIRTKPQPRDSTKHLNYRVS